MIKYRASQLILVLMLITHWVLSQEAPVKLLYQKQKIDNATGHSLSNEQSRYEIAKPRLVRSGVHERVITTTEGNFTVISDKKAKKYTLKDPAGLEVASFWIKGKSKLDITLSDGTVYDWQKGKNSREWKYVVNSKEVLTSAFVKADGKKYVQYEVKDAQSTGISSIALISHTYGVDLIQQKAKQPIIFLVIAAVAVIQVVATSGDAGPDV